MNEIQRPKFFFSFFLTLAQYLNYGFRGGFYLFEIFYLEEKFSISSITKIITVFLFLGYSLYSL